MSQEPGKTKIILADDHAAIRMGIRTMIGREDDLEVIDEVSNGEDLLDSLRKNPCDVVVTDLSMPKMDGIQAVEQIKKEFPAVKVLVLSMHRDRDIFKKAMSKGVSGYVLKSEPLENIVIALKKVIDGQKAYSDELESFAMDDYATLLESSVSLSLLSQREKDVLQRVARGAANKDIAADLNISIRTVEAHRARIMSKLKMKNVQELVKYSISQGLI